MGFKINPFKPFIYGVYYMCSSVSPISRVRFKSERRQRVLQNLRDSATGELSPTSSAREDFRSEYNCWWHKLMHPHYLIKLIKRQHMVGNLYLVYLFGHLLVLFHLNIKSIVHTFYTGSNVEKIEQFNNGLYPHLAGVFPEPYLFNNLFLVAGLLALSSRLLKTYHLLDASISNENFYKKLTVTQINISSFSGCELSLKDWLTFFMQSIRQPEVSAEQVRAHYKLNPIIEKQLPNLSQNDLLFYVNPIDFENCYSKKSMHRKVSGEFLDWYRAPPILRVSPRCFRDISFLVTSMVCTIIMIPTTSLIGLSYLELTAKLNVLRLIELFMFIVLQVPIYLDALLLQVDLIVLISRTKKLRSDLEDDFEQCRSKAARSGGYSRSSIKDEYFYSQHHKSFTLLTGHRRMSLLERVAPSIRPPGDPSKLNYHQRYLINQQIFTRIRLLGLIYLEFNNLKRAHSAFLNIIILGNSLYLSYSISLLIVITTYGELVIVVLAIISSFTATMLSLLVCAGVEREVS